MDPGFRVFRAASLACMRRSHSEQGKIMCPLSLTQRHNSSPSISEYARLQGSPPARSARASPAHEMRGGVLLRQETATWGGCDLGDSGVWERDYGWGVRVLRSLRKRRHLAHAEGVLYGMELGSVTLKRIGFFCFPIKHSNTHTPQRETNLQRLVHFCKGTPQYFTTTHLSSKNCGK